MYDLSITPPRIVNTRVIGRAPAHGDLRAWDEVFPDGTVKSFEEFHHIIVLPTFGPMGTVGVRETTLRKFKVDLTTSHMQGPVDHWTHVLAKDADDARRQLERDGHEVRHIEVAA